MPIFNSVFKSFYEWKPGANTLVYYNINDNDTSTTIYDLSGNGNNLTGSSIQYTTDSAAGRVLTSGRPTHSIINFGNEFTFLVWGKLTSRPGNAACPFSNGSGSSSYASNGILISNKIAYVYGTGTSSSTSISSGETESLDVWRLRAFTRNSSGTVTVYINGAYKNSGTISSVTYPSGTTFMLGGWGGGGNDFTGYIKELIGENKTRTADEISKYYNGTKANYGL